MIRMGKIFVSYKIETLVAGIVKPGDELKGKIFLRNEDKKDQKLKYVGVNVQEHCIRIEHDPDFGNMEVDDGRNLRKVEVFSGGKIEPGETKEFDFIVKLPSFPSPRLQDWHVSLDFVQKTGLIKTKGKDAEEAKCVLPVPGSMRVPAIGNLKGLQ